MANVSSSWSRRFSGLLSARVSFARSLARRRFSPARASADESYAREAANGARPTGLFRAFAYTAGRKGANEGFNSIAPGCGLLT